MAVEETTFADRFAGTNTKEREELKKNNNKKRRSIISRLLCSKRSTNSNPPRKSRFGCLKIDSSNSSPDCSSPEISSPVRMPHFMKNTACYDAKKESFQGEIENSRGDRKMATKQSTVESSSIETSDSSSFDSSDNNRSNSASSSLKSFPTLTRSSSLKAVRVSFKSKKRYSSRGSTESKTVDQATCSSTIKNSKFPEKVELQPGQAESERLSVYKVCRYHHCSLNGHSHDSSSSLSSAKRFRLKRLSKKPEKTIEPRNDSADRKGLALQMKTNTESQADLIEIAFGETSFPERNYQETLNQIEKTAELCCGCKCKSETENRQRAVDSEAKSSSLEAPAPKKEKSLSLWSLIHHHMASGSIAEFENKSSSDPDEASSKAESKSSNDPDEASSNADVDGDENQEMEVEKLFAVKLVREAIEKILLPEVPDQSSEDQSVTSETPTENEAIEINNDDNGREVTTKPEKKAPKHWSNLKKWILLQRFIKELEKVRKINPRKPRELELEHDPEAEKVHLRPQTTNEKKRDEEWMLDYALQQAINQLAPIQKRKVGLLVRAFETVVPPNNNIQSLTLLKFKSDLEQQNEFSSEAKETIHQAEEIVPSETDAHESTLVENEIEPSVDEVVADTEQVDQKLEATEDVLEGTEGKSESMAECRGKNLEKGRYISMWHMISRHVLSDVVSKAGVEVLDGTDDDEVEDANTAEDKNRNSSQQRRNFSRDDAIKLVREVVNEILVTQAQDGTLPEQNATEEHNATGSFKQSNRNEEDTIPDQNATEEHNAKESFKESNRNEEDTIPTEEHNATESFKESNRNEATNGEDDKAKPKMSKLKNWNKVKKLLLLKRSIAALENARKLEYSTRQDRPETPNTEPEKVDLRPQVIDERKKAEEWMLDYAVQNIVTKLTPARKRRVAMLVEAFEAVVPLPQVY